MRRSCAHEHHEWYSDLSGALNGYRDFPGVLPLSFKPLADLYKRSDLISGKALKGELRGIPIPDVSVVAGYCIGVLRGAFAPCTDRLFRTGVMDAG
jgi:hypothetical protein